MPKSVHSRKYKRLVDCLKGARIAADLTQADVAKALKRPQSFVSKCESRERRIDFIELLDFCRLYNLSLDAILHELE